MVAALLAIALQEPSFPTPPFVREKTLRIEWMGRPSIEGNIAYFPADGTVRAFDLNQWRELWKWKAIGEESIHELLIAGNNLFLATSTFDEPRKSRLVAIDKSTGVEVWSLQRSGPTSEIVVDGGTLYTAMEAESLSAIDLRSRNRLWTTTLKLPTSEGSERASAEVVTRLEGGHVFVSSYDNHALAINARTGTVDWSVAGAYSFGGTPSIMDGVVVIATSEALEGRDATTGRLLWTGERSTPSFSMEFGTRLLMVDEDVFAIEPRTGRVVWRIPLASEEAVSTYDEGGFIQAGSAVLNTDRGVMLIDIDGRILWRLPVKPGFARPYWTDGQKIVAYDSGRLMSYKRGAHEPLPSDSEGREKLATKLVTEFELLDSAEVARLEELGDDAFEAVLAEYVRRAQAYDDVPDTDENFSTRSSLYDAAYDLAEVLRAIFRPGRTPLVIETVEGLPAGQTARKTLTELLSRQGDKATSLEFLLSTLRTINIESSEIPQEAWTAIYAAAKSSHETAVGFLIAALKNEKAEPRIRELAYRNLARTGGEGGLAAVLAARNPRRLLPPLIERMELDELDNPDRRWPRTELYERRTDASGRTWGLIRNGALANSQDLWIVEEVGGKWVRPYLTGAQMPGESRRRPTDENKKFYGRTAKELVEGAWFEVLVGNAEILLDSDGDGLTDLMEVRLGTDPKKADTDGDGDNDLVDPWPDTVQRKMNDTESVFAAVFEAKYHFDSHSEPAIFSSDDVAVPFEIPGRLGPVLWSRKDDNSRRLSPLMECYENGVAMISFHEARDFDDESPPTGNTLLWNTDRTEATVIISTYWGGLAGDGTFARVRKFGETWVVVEMETRYVS